MTEPITIIGAGIGGLSTALAIQRNGLPVRVYESAPQIRPVGAGIIMASNAMQIYRKMGLDEQIVQAGYRVSRIRITDPRLKPLSEVNLSGYEKKYGVHHVAIHRGDLQRILAAALGPEHIVLSKRLSGIEKQGTFRLSFEDGSQLDSAVVIGADGIRSVVRDGFFRTGTLRDSGQICWRGLADLTLPDTYRHEANEAWGRGRRFGFVRLNARQVYWYAVINAAGLQEESPDLSEGFRDFHPDMLDIMKATPPDQIFQTGLQDLEPLAAWQGEGACLIGDAAHATTPNLGQGACQAVEDAYVIGRLLKPGADPAEAFAAYESFRRKKARRVVMNSRMIGSVSQLESKPLIWLRNQMMRATPAFAGRKQLDWLFELREP